jgi:hypothetical protein
MRWQAEQVLGLKIPVLSSPAPAGNAPLLRRMNSHGDGSAHPSFHQSINPSIELHPSWFKRDNACVAPSSSPSTRTRSYTLLPRDADSRCL